MKPHLPIAFVAALLASTGSSAAKPAAKPAAPASAPHPAAPAAPQLAQPGPMPVPRTNYITTMDAQFQAADANKDGILTRQEIEQYQRAQAAAQAQAQGRALFARLDTDRDGQLSPAEFAQLAVNVPPPNAAPVLAEADRNKDGSISLAEWRAAKLANFDRLDTDKDSIVSVAEMRAGGLIK